LENNREMFSKKYNINPEFTIFFIGGSEIYKKCAPICDTLWITKINKVCDCDLFLSVDVNEKKYNAETIVKNDDFTITKFEKK
jgi:dihydrofolate reductase